MCSWRFFPIRHKKEGELEVVISCNPIWGGRDAPRKSSLPRQEEAERERTAAVKGTTANSVFMSSDIGFLLLALKNNAKYSFSWNPDL